MYIQRTPRTKVHGAETKDPMTIINYLAPHRDADRRVQRIAHPRSLSSTDFWVTTS